MFFTVMGCRLRLMRRRPQVDQKSGVSRSPSLSLLANGPADDERWVTAHRPALTVFLRAAYEAKRFIVRELSRVALNIPALVTVIVCYIWLGLGEVEGPTEGP